jgi:hypothetical protein
MQPTFSCLSPKALVVPAMSVAPVASWLRRTACEQQHSPKSSLSLQVPVVACS